MQFFYHPDITSDSIVLSPEESRHCIKALRKKAGDAVFITDGKGNLIEGEIATSDLNGCMIQVTKRIENHDQRKLYLHIAIAPTKNPDRIEWFVEKAIEIGIEKISFIHCENSERSRIDLNRLNRIAVSAIKQSNSTQIPDMELCSFDDLLNSLHADEYEKYIAWCDYENRNQLSQETFLKNKIMLLIGPEGDFSLREIELAGKTGFKEVKLGNRRLRTETAGLYGCCLINGKFNYSFS